MKPSPPSRIDAWMKASGDVQMQHHSYRFAHTPVCLLQCPRRYPGRLKEIYHPRNQKIADDRDLLIGLQRSGLDACQLGHQQFDAGPDLS
ncbi:hypothetical protein Trydic_g13261 [Trypoxylus dichotomus]